MGEQGWQRRRVLFVAAALFVFTDGPLFFVSHKLLGRPGPAWEDEVVFAGLLGAAGMSGLLVLADLFGSRGRRPSEPHSVGAAAVAGFTLMIAASTAWSVNALHTGWRSAVYLGLALLAGCWRISATARKGR